MVRFGFRVPSLKKRLSDKTRKHQEAGAGLRTPRKLPITGSITERREAAWC